MNPLNFLSTDIWEYNYPFRLQGKEIRKLVFLSLRLLKAFPHLKNPNKLNSFSYT